MPYVIKQKKCTQVAGDSGTHILSYTDGKGKKHDNCHTSEQNAQDQIAAIEGGPLDETDPMMFGGGGLADEEEYGGAVSEIRSLVRALIINEKARKKSPKLLFKGKFLAHHSARFKEMGSGATPGEKDVRFGLEDAALLAEPDFSASDEVAAITALPGYTIVNEVPPGGGAQSRSGKYTTYIVQDGEDNSFPVVFGSPNAGEKFEKLLHKQLVDRMGPLADELLDALNLPSSAIDSIENLAGARKRPLTGEINDVGAQISDITINLVDGYPLYISLKNSDGTTFMNAGYAGAFSESGGTVSSSSHPLDKFVEALGIDKALVTSGIQDYISHTPTTGAGCAKKLSANFNPSIVAEYLASGLGYGYVYARRHEDGYTIKVLDSAGDAVSLIGQPTSVTLSYPRWCDDGKDVSKQVTASVDTDTGAKFTVEIRSSSKATPMPNEIKIKINRYPQEMESRNLTWGRISSDFADAGEYELWAHFSRSGNLVSEKILRDLIRESLLLEELTGRDKDEIKRIARKEAEKIASKKEIEKVFKKKFDTELKKALGTSWIGAPGKINKFVQDAIAKEIKVMFNDKITQNQIADLSKAVIKKLYRQLSFSSVQIIDRIKL